MAGHRGAEKVRVHDHPLEGIAMTQELSGIEIGEYKYRAVMERHFVWRVQILTRASGLYARTPDGSRIRYWRSKAAAEAWIHKMKKQHEERSKP